MLFRNIILTTALLLSAGIAGAAELLSPDGNVKLTFDLTAQGEPMEYVTVARKAKNSDDWFVGCSNGIEPRVSEIDFSFLPAGQKYQAAIYRDGKNAHYRNAPQDYVIETKTVTSKSKLKLWTASSGGYAIRLTPLR